MRNLVIIVVSALMALGVLVAGVTNLDLGAKMVTKGSYYAVLIMTAFWIFITFPFFREALKNKYKQIIVCLIMAVVVFVSMPPKYRVLSDETNLLSVSQSMNYKREILNVTQAKFYYGNLNVIQGDLPTRPLLFPFLTNLVHTVAGYHYQNAFVLNFIILFGILLMTFLVVESSMGQLSAAAACLLLLSIPTLTLSATSGGFDICSLFFFGLSFVFLYRFLISPSTDRFAMLLIQLIMLAQIRYESIAYVAIILGTLFMMRRISMEMITRNYLLIAASPFFILPMLLQRKLTPNTFENPPGVPPFALEHFIKHSKMLVEAMIFSKPEYPYPSYLNLVAVLMLVFLVFKVAPKCKEHFNRNESTFASLLMTSIGVSLVIVLFHHFGVFPHPTQARLFLIFLSFLALMPIIFSYFFPQILNEKKLLVLAVVSFAMYHPVATQGRFTNSLTIIRETEEMYRFLEQQNDPKILLIAERPGQFTVANYGAVGFGFANGNKASLVGDLNRGLISNIWVFQKHAYDTGKALPDQKLDAEFDLEPVKDYMVTATEFMRISRVKRPFYPIQPEKAPVSTDTGPKLDKEMGKIFDNIKFK